MDHTEQKKRKIKEKKSSVEASQLLPINLPVKKPPKLLKSIVIIIVVVIGIGIYYASSRVANAPEQTEASDQQILSQLKTILFLPEDVSPSMAVVTDAGKLKEQQPNFFANAKNGDRVILYPDLAIIYDYQANKIIKIGPVQNVKP